MKITCVIENTATFASKFYAEHGLSILIDDGNSKVLFDTGKSPEILEKNLGLINGFEGLKKVVLSHGHNDHTGGLSCILKNSSADILMHANALLPKYVLKNGNMKFIGTEILSDHDPRKTTEEENKSNDSHISKMKSNFKFIKKTSEIAPNMFIFPEISLNNNFEETDPSFFVKENGRFLKDDFEDELVLVIKTNNGLVIVSGCAHRGIMNTISSVAEYFNDDVYAVVGGTHLVSANVNRINSTFNDLKKFELGLLGFGHCNGFDASCRFKNEFGDIFKVLESGKEIINME